MYKYLHFGTVMMHTNSAFHNVYLHSVIGIPLLLFERRQKKEYILKLLNEVPRIMHLLKSAIWAKAKTYMKKHNLPVYPMGHSHVYSTSDFKWHVPSFWHGDESHAFSTWISHSDSVKPMGQMHSKRGVPSRNITWHVPPFWHRGPGPVWHGLGCSQKSPVYRDVQLKWKEYWKWLFRENNLVTFWSIWFESICNASYYCMIDLKYFATSLLILMLKLWVVLSL